MSWVRASCFGKQNIHSEFSEPHEPRILCKTEASSWEMNKIQSDQLTSKKVRASTAVVSECRTSNMQAKRASARNKDDNTGACSCFELPSPRLTGSQSNWFRTSLGCKPRSLMRVSLGRFDYSKSVRKNDPTLAYLPVGVRRRFYRACWSPLGAKSASIDAPNKRSQFTGEQHHRII
jgi:hypothetical protein